MTSAHDRARQLAIAQDFGAEALRLNEELVAANPADVASRTRLARCCREAGRTEESESQYREVLRLEPRNRIAAGGLEQLADARRRAEAPVVPVITARLPRPRSTPVVRHASTAPRRTVELAPPPVFAGFHPSDFAELRFCDAREVRERFGPRVVDLVKRVNALKSSEEIASVREEGRRRLFRASRNEVHTDTARWSAHNTGGRWEPQFTFGMHASRSGTGDYLRAGIGFHMADDGDGADGEGGVQSARRHFQRFQQFLGTAPRSLFLGWMIKENGLIEIGRSGPRVDVRQPSQAADLIAGCDPERTAWVFFGKWLFADQPDEAAVMADPVQLVRTIDRVLTGLLPLWRVFWRDVTSTGASA